MLIQSPTYSTGFQAGVSPDNAALPSLAKHYISLPQSRFPLPAAADGIFEWRREWAYGADTDESVLIDNFPLLHVDGAIVRNACGLPCTFTGIFLVHIRLEKLDDAQDCAGDVEMTFADFGPAGTGTVPAGLGDFVYGEREAVRAVTGGSSLQFDFTGMSNKRLTVLIVGVETEDNETVYS